MSPPREPIRGRFPPASDAERATLLRYVAEAPLLYGEWKQIKGLYKQAEGAREAEILGTLIGRLDAEPLQGPHPFQEPQPGYLPTGSTQAVAMSGSTAYVAAGGIHTVDLSTPARPQRLGSATVRDVRALAVQEELLDAAGRGLRVVEVSQPSRPRPVGTLDAGELHRIVAAGRHVYCLRAEDPRNRGGLLIIDVSDPTRPAQVGFVEIRGARDLAVSGRHADVVGESSRRGWFGLRQSGGLSVIDVANPRQPRLAGEVTVAAARGIAIAGSYAYVVTGGERGGRGSLQVFHLYAPASPRPAGSVPLRSPWPVAAGRCHLAAHAGVVYLADSSAGVRVFNAANPTHPLAVGSLPGYGAQGIALHGSVLCIASSYGGLSLFDVTDPARAVQLGRRPSRDTFAYMKRRARRHLRRLAELEPDQFVRVACHALLAAGRAQAELDPGHQWVTLDLLFGGSGLYAQAGHGQGSCYPRSHRRYLRTREERAPQAWDRRPDLAQRLLAADALPWQTREAALKMLRAQRASPPALPPGALAQMLASPSPLLVLAAARDTVRQLLAGASVEPEVAAAAFFAGGGQARRRLAERWSERTESPDWQARFAARLSRIVGERSTGGAPGRRIVAAAALLAERFASAVSGEALLPVAVALLASGREDLQSLAAALVATASPAAAPEWLAALERLPERPRETALEALIAALRGRAMDLPTARRLAHAGSTWLREAGWRMLAALPADPAVLAALWSELLSTEGLPPALRTALHTAAALETLDVVRRLDASIDDRLAGQALRAELLTEESLVAVVGAAPAGLLARMVAAAPEADWQRLRGPFAAALVDSGRVTPFWRAAWTALERDAAGLLERRLLQDPRIADTFLDAEGAEFLESHFPSVGPLLLRWVESRREQFPRDSAELLAAATSPLPEVRDWGLRRVSELGMELPFALRLLELGLPPAMAVGQAFFEALPAGDEEELEHALALCDSPEPSVQAFGREYIQQRQPTLLLADVIEHLREHANPRMQEFVARTLLETPDLAPRAASFDREVLRAPDRGRRAKELVKRRLETVPPEEIPLLLEIARTGAARDAEWAWSQLARLALNGHEIEGFSVEGTAGV